MSDYLGKPIWGDDQRWRWPYRLRPVFMWRTLKAIRRARRLRRDFPDLMIHRSGPYIMAMLKRAPLEVRDSKPESAYDRINIFAPPVCDKCGRVSFSGSTVIRVDVESTRCLRCGHIK